METTLRNATLNDLVGLLREQQDVRYDVVAASNKLRMVDGRIHIEGGHAVVTDEGVTLADAILTPTDIFDAGLADKLDIPIRYLRKMRSAEKSDLLDHNVNEWLHATQKPWFIRGFKAESSEEGMARSFLSSGYRVLDHLDSLMGALAGIRRAGVSVEVKHCDLSERRMTVKLEAPEIGALAPVLLRNYRSPFTGESGADNPLISAGLAVSNSETGGGAFTISPYLTVQVCKNGMTMTKDALRQVHLGAKMDEGLVKWSDDTLRKNVELVTAQAADAVATFLDVDYVERKVAELEAISGAPVRDVTGTLERVGKRFGFSEAEQDLILADFIAGGDVTAGGVMQAVTSAAQRIVDPDRANDLEGVAFDVLSFAAAG